MLVIMAAHTIYRLRFVYATLSTILVLVGYEYIAIAHQKLLASGDGFAGFCQQQFLLRILRNPRNGGELFP